MVTTLEMLSNEMIMEIFQYLDAYHLFQALFNLNSRLNQLLGDPQLYLTFNSKYVHRIDKKKSQMWYTMVKHLTAVTIIQDMRVRLFLSAFSPKDLIRLQSLTLHRVCIGKGKKWTDNHEFV